MPPSPEKVLERKLGPAPVWVWAVVAAGGYVLWRRYRGTSGNTAPSSFLPAAGTGTNVGTAGGDGGAAPSGGGGTVVDNLNPSLLSAIGGLAGSLSYALVSSVSAVDSLGTEALRQSGALQQAIIGSYVPVGKQGPSGVQPGPGGSGGDGPIWVDFGPVPPEPRKPEPPPRPTPGTGGTQSSSSVWNPQPSVAPETERVQPGGQIPARMGGGRAV